ncbi:MAG: hypothetical protein D8M59_16570 [Planctomycetes bacterium]|nr:hypothetical protein [Planctomycetota bacterium]NOG53166.1 hypothetical protein [Planctomycetota bacterium]
MSSRGLSKEELESRHFDLRNEKSELDQAAQHNEQELSRLNSRADGMGGKQHQVRLWETRAEKNQIGAARSENAAELAENEQQLHQAYADEWMRENGMHRGYNEAELSAHTLDNSDKDHRFVQGLKDAEEHNRKRGVYESADGPAGAIGLAGAAVHEHGKNKGWWGKAKDEAGDLEVADPSPEKDEGGVAGPTKDSGGSLGKAKSERSDDSIKVSEKDEREPER